MSKYDKVVENMPGSLIFRPDHNEDCLHCAVTTAIFDFFDRHTPADQRGVDIDMIIDDVGQVLAEWIASVEDNRQRKDFAEICGKVLKRRVREYRAAGNYPGSLDHQHATKQ